MADQRIVNEQRMDPVVQRYFDEMMERARGISERGRQTYDGQRIAGPTGLQSQSWQGIASLGMAGLPQSFLQGEAGAAGTLGAMRGMGERGYGDLSGVAGNFGAAGSQGYDNLMKADPKYDSVYGRAGNVERWIDPGMAEKYMSPYQEQVNDIQVRGLERAGARQQTQLGGMAASMGAFGGGRHALMQENMAGNTREQISDAIAMGQRDAYNAGIGAFNQDRNAQQRGIDQQLGALAGQTNARNLATQSQMMGLRGESNALMGANQLLQSGLNSEMSGANTLAQIGGMGQDMNMQLLGAMNDAGTQQRGIEQQFLNQGYQDFLGQRDWEKQNLEWFQNMLQGLPQMGLTSTYINQRDPHWANAAAGAGAGGVAVNSVANAPVQYTQ